MVINVSSNGYVTFGATAPSSSYSTPISGTTAYDGAIAAFGRDICSYFDVNGTSGSIKWEVVGTAPNREVVIQWENFRPSNTAAVTTVYSFSFQIRLKETSNIIDVVYSGGAYLQGTTTYALNAQIGLRGASNADFNNRKNSTTELFTASVQGTANNSVQEFHTVNATPGMFSQGLTYTWTPATCYPPTSVTVTGITTTSANLQWTAPSSVPSNGYEVYYSNTSSVAPIATTPATITGLTTTSTPLSNLAHSSNYNVWVRSVCSPTDKSVWTLVTNFSTLCNAITGAYSENFDSYTAGTNTAAPYSLPNCWTNLGTSNGAHMINGTADYIISGNSVYMWPSGGRVCFIATPPLSTLQSGLYKLSFTIRSGVTAGGVLEVGYLDASNNFVLLQTFSTTAPKVNYDYSLNIPILPNGISQLAFRNTGLVNTYSISLDNISYQLQTQLGTSEITAKDAFKIHPNPFTDVFNIDNVDKVKSISVFDVTGRLVKSNIKVSGSINLSDLKPGMYLLNLELKDGSKVSHKIMKK